MRRVEPRPIARALLGASCALSLLACGGKDDDRPPRANFTAPSDTAEPAPTGIPVPGGPPAGCGDEEIAAIVDVPRLYFVLDRSGSMSEALPGQSRSKWQAAQTAVVTLLRAIGHRVEYGAATFPGSANSCDAGRQLMPFTRGDAPNPTSNRNGPNLQHLVDRLSLIEPDGGTPVAATLAALRPVLEGSSSRTYVILATDGAPNCNPDATCGAAACIPDIEGAFFEGMPCGVEFSCCDPAFIGKGAGGNCVDDDAAFAEVTALAEAGIPTYIVGMPGAGAFEQLLDRLAVAGGTAREGDQEPRYFAVEDETELGEALLQIGAGVAIDCDLTLSEVPEDASLVNVYYDGEVVAYDPENGWEWDGDSALSLRGAACDELRSGKVANVAIVYGCNTVIE
jgi:hypothetical protein